MGGKNIEDIDITSYRKEIAYVGSALILEDSIRRNLDFNSDFSDGEISRIVDKCNLNDLLAKKGWTLDEPVAIKERELSQGEKQKISVARALIRKPKIFILDEPTANLDNHSTEQIITTTNNN